MYEELKRKKKGKKNRKRKKKRKRTKRKMVFRRSMNKKILNENFFNFLSSTFIK